MYKQKGFALTADSIAAFSLAVLLATTILFTVRSQGNKNVFSNLSSVAEDKVMMAIYFHKKIYDDFNAGRKNIICQSYYILEPDSDYTTKTPAEKLQMCLKSSLVIK